VSRSYRRARPADPPAAALDRHPERTLRITKPK
jgi:hypothetical protein